jgi:hypothetical protein
VPQDRGHLFLDTSHAPASTSESEAPRRTSSDLPVGAEGPAFSREQEMSIEGEIVRNAYQPITLAHIAQAILRHLSFIHPLSHPKTVSLSSAFPIKCIVSEPFRYHESSARMLSDSMSSADIR